MNVHKVITIDGPSASGKSILSVSLSKYLKWFVLDSGVLYRIIAFLFLKHKCNFSQEHYIYILDKLENYFIYQDGYINCLTYRDIKHVDLMSHQVTSVSSKLATIAYIRNVLLFKQRLFLRKPGLIASGRDMGTVVFPNAILKFFLQSTLITRVHRRMCDFNNLGINISFNDLYNTMKKRDYRDINRKYSALKPANNAIIINSDNMTFFELLNYVISYVNKFI
ncbi:Cytidylate kinase [Buchnera aphidicola (Pterocallis alni)]|uniref:(d)CMP kinase n=1 Tax=Buchnera aphidicola TaxID=9 RepID=UPI00346454CA